MFVYNNCKHDARVLKEAKTLADAGYSVKIIALLDQHTEPYEERDGFSIIRVERNPIHLRILRGFREAKFPGHIFSAGVTQLTIAVKRLFGFKTETQNEPDGSRSLSRTEKIRMFIEGVKDEIRTKGRRRFVRENLKKYPPLLVLPLFLFTLGHYLYTKVLYRRIMRPARIFWYRYVKRAWYWGVKRPARILWYRHIRKFWYRSVRRPLIRLRQSLKKAWYWGVKRPYKIALSRTRKKTYALLKAILMPFHRPLSYLDYYVRAYRLLKNDRADIYHAHDLNTLPVAYFAHRASPGSKLVYDSHELYMERNMMKKRGRINKLLLTKIESLLIKKAHAVITVNESIALELSARYRINKPAVIMNAPHRISHEITSSDTNLREILNIPAANKLLLYLGGITFNRGLEELIQSLVYLRDSYLVVMGYGPEQYKEELQGLAEKTGVGARFIFYGPVQHEDVVKYAASADLGVAPIKNSCLSYYLSLPNKLFEYVVAGIPVIGSDFPEIKRVIETYNIGLTFDPDDPKDIARAANQIFKDPKKYNLMRENARRAAKILNWENEAKKLTQLYEGL